MKYFLAAFLTFCLITHLDAQTVSKNGLETKSTTPLCVFVEDLSKSALELGLSKELIEARVNKVLRKAGITPTGLRPNDACLRILVSVESKGFHVSTALYRMVFYKVNDTVYTIAAPTWERSCTGMTFKNDSDYILKSTEDMTEIFCNEFLKSNGK